MLRAPGRVGPLLRLATSILCTLVVLSVLGCRQSTEEGGGGQWGEPVERFTFVQAPDILARIDSATGNVWFVPDSGEGGWTPLGAIVSAPEDPGESGRFTVRRMVWRTLDGTEVQFVRFDRATGRSWIIEPKDEAQWTPIDDSALAAAEYATESVEVDVLQQGAPPGEDPPVELAVLPREVLVRGSSQPGEEVRVIAEALEKDGISVQIKVWAARQLAVFEPELAVPPLLEALDSEHPEVVVAAITSLQKTGDPSTIPRILKLRDHSDPRVRAAVESVVVETR